MKKDKRLENKTRSYYNSKLSLYIWIFKRNDMHNLINKSIINKKKKHENSIGKEKVYLTAGR